MHQRSWHPQLPVAHSSNQRGRSRLTWARRYHSERGWARCPTFGRVAQGCHRRAEVNQQLRREHCKKRKEKVRVALVIERTEKSLPNDLPVLSRGTRWRNSCTSKLRSSLSVDPCHTLLGVGSTWETDIGKLSTEVTMMSLVDHESILRDRLGVDLIRIEEINELGLRGRGLLGRNKANVISR